MEAHLGYCQQSIVELLQKQPPEVFHKKIALKNFTKFTGKHLCQSLFFLSYRSEAYNHDHATYNFIKKKTLAQVFSCEFSEIVKNTSFMEHLRTTAFTFSP